MAIARTAGVCAGIPSLVGEGRRFYQDDNLHNAAFRKFLLRAKGNPLGFWQKTCPQCRLLHVKVWFQGPNCGSRLRRHLDEHYAIRILGRDERQWALECQARQKRLRGVTSA